MTSILNATNDFPWPLLNLQGQKLVSLTESLMNAGTRYGLGAKASPLSLQAGQFASIDCSGFVRWAIWHATRATGEALEVPDGSYDQHDWVNANGFKVSSFEDGLLSDDVIRIGFLSPSDGGGVGHVVLILNGQTLESHGLESNGNQGPDQRVWGSESWMRKMSLFVLANS